MRPVETYRSKHRALAAAILRMQEDGTISDDERPEYDSLLGEYEAAGDALSAQEWVEVDQEIPVRYGKHVDHTNCCHATH
jgi:hypothetical protein